MKREPIHRWSVTVDPSTPKAPYGYVVRFGELGPVVFRRSGIKVHATACSLAREKASKLDAEHWARQAN